jgi:hypothetical protein
MPLFTSHGARWSRVAFVMAFVAQLVGVLALLRVGTMEVEKDNLYYARDQALKEAPKKIPYLAIGDSQTRSALDETLIPGLFNYSAHAESMVFGYGKLRHAFEVLEKEVDWVLIPANRLMFTNIDLSLSHQIAYYDQYFEAEAEPADISSDWAYAVRSFQALTWMPYLGNGFMLVATALGIDPRAGEKREDRARRRPVSEREAKRHLYRYIGAPDGDVPWEVFPVPPVPAYFSKILDLVHAHGARPVVISYPVHHHFAEHAELRLRWSELEKRLQAIIDSKEYPVSWMDHMNLYAEEDWAYSDPNHLGPMGRQKFSWKVLSALKALDRQLQAD